MLPGHGNYGCRCSFTVVSVTSLNLVSSLPESDLARSLILAWRRSSTLPATFFNRPRYSFRPNPAQGERHGSCTHVRSCANWVQAAHRSSFPTTETVGFQSVELLYKTSPADCQNTKNMRSSVFTAEDLGRFLLSPPVFQMFLLVWLVDFPCCPGDANTMSGPRFLQFENDCFLFLWPFQI